MNNGTIASFFETIADLMQVRGDNTFKIRAYRRAAETIRALPRDIREDARAGTLQEIPGIGEAIADKIAEIVETGRLGFLERLEAEIPAGVAAMMRVPEVGPKSARAIWDALGLASLEELETAAREGRLQGVPGIGAKTEARILAGIQALQSRSERALLGTVLPRAEGLLGALRAAAGPVLRTVEVVGSLRRRVATVGNMNLLAMAEPEQVAAVLDAWVRLPQVGSIEAEGAGWRTVLLHTGEQAELRVVSPGAWGRALQTFTGSATHTERLRERAAALGLGLDAIEVEEEADLYARLGLPWIPPELREDGSEVEAALKGTLPNLVNSDALRGDLHTHSTWSDGKGSILEMAQAARALGYAYLVISDHSQSLAIAGGLSVDRLRTQREEIQGVNARFTDFVVLQGSEVEILADGSLDYPDEVLAELDVVVASMHTGTRGERAVLTERMLRAVCHPHVDIIGHMTNRLLGRRAGADLDMEVVLQAAAEHGTILEINAQPDRLDLDAMHARRALELDCLLSVDSDAHHPDGLAGIGLGITQARRAWAEAGNVVNTRPLGEFLRTLKPKNGKG